MRRQRRLRVGGGVSWGGEHRESPCGGPQSLAPQRWIARSQEQRCVSARPDRDSARVAAVVPAAVFREGGVEARTRAPRGLPLLRH